VFATKTCLRLTCDEIQLLARQSFPHKDGEAAMIVDKNKFLDTGEDHNRPRYRVKVILVSMRFDR
jgi:hypothetical protein